MWGETPKPERDIIETTEDPLAMAERHVREGEERIARQEAIVAELERGGHTAAAATARELLVPMQAFLASSREHLARLLRQTRT